MLLREVLFRERFDFDGQCFPTAFKYTTFEGSNIFDTSCQCFHVTENVSVTDLSRKFTRCPANGPSRCPSKHLSTGLSAGPPQEPSRALAEVLKEVLIKAISTPSEEALANAIAKVISKGSARELETALGGAFQLASKPP
jgi:hypothetical protein